MSTMIKEKIQQTSGLPARKSAKHRKGSATISTIVKYVLLSIVAFIVVFPYIWMVISSFKMADEIFDMSHILPRRIAWENYPEALRSAPFERFFINSFVVCFIMIVGQFVTCALAAYGFAKLKFKSKNFFFMLFMASMMIPSEVTIISNFMTIYQLGWTNTYIGLAATHLTSVFGIFLLRQFFMTVPDALTDAAYIDGCNEIMVFFRIFLPLSKSALATVGIFAFISGWNSFMWPMTVTTAERMRTVQVGLKYMINPDTGSNWPGIMAASTLAILPVMIIFIFLQKYFVQGITKVGIK